MPQTLYVMQKKLLIIAQVWPEPTTTAAGSRILQLIQCFQKQNYHITIASTAAESKHSLALSELQIKKVAIQLNHSSFDDFVSGLNPDVVLFDRFITEEQFGWRVAEFASKALRILDTEDLHSLRLTREKCFKNNISFATDEWLKNETTKRELAGIYKSDITLVISSYEMYLLKNIISIDSSLIMHLPFLLDTISTDESKSWKSFVNRQDFICIGNGMHAPNVDALVWLKKEIWPLIKKSLPKANLNIYGAYLPNHIEQMHNTKEGFLIHGWAPDAHHVMQKARVNLAPLRFGAGLKGKLITAMQNGTPSVTTKIGAEGMHDEINWCGVIADNAQEFADAAVHLYQEESTWRQAQQNGIKIINTHYNKDDWQNQLNQKTESVSSNLDKHRLQNFTGSLLQHQSMQASKYMSKWIEEKNSKYK